MTCLRRRLSYANVVSTLALFLVLAGGAAVAANRVAHKVGRRTVGAAQLKSGAVTTTKIKANAITTRKIKREAISNEKLKSGAVNTEKINLADVPFGRVVARLRGNQSVPLEEKPKLIPLVPATYTQAADEVDSFVGAVDVLFPSSCEPPRGANAFLLLDTPLPTGKIFEDEVTSLGRIEDTTTGTVTRRIQIAPYISRGISFEPGSPQTHSISLVVSGSCKTGSATATFGAVDVLGTR
jgi:hypothetical protein